MVSRRNYVTIAIMFLILFFMFQFTGVMKNQLNQYGVNEYEMNDRTDLGAQDTFDASAVHAAAQKVAYVGPQSSNVRDVVYWWCTYTKRAFTSYASLEECTYLESDKPDMIVLDGQLVVDNVDDAIVKRWADDGIDLVFSGMPENAHLRVKGSARHIKSTAE